MRSKVHVVDKVMEKANAHKDTQQVKSQVLVMDWSWADGKEERFIKNESCFGLVNLMDDGAIF
jgi:hypothetical protein